MAKVSICLPNLNNRAFLEERVQSIRDQTFSDWELVVVDNFSNDGAWEYFQAVAINDSKIRISQAERSPDGMYPNWNNTIRLAEDEYVYIATSDDTMPPDFLEKMVAALDRNPSCDIAHAPLKTFDSRSEEIPDTWTKGAIFPRLSGDLLNKPHIRHAPLDGLLFASGESVYVSITQLLFRRTIFEKVGSFNGHWGSMGDFHWNMRAALQCDTVHVPDTWGGWRIHESQATDSNSFKSEAHQRKINEMIESALVELDGRIDPAIQKLICEQVVPRYAARAKFIKSTLRYKSRLRRLAHQLIRLLTGDKNAREYLQFRYLGDGPWYHDVYFRELLGETWIQKHLSVIENQ